MKKSIFALLVLFIITLSGCNNHNQIVDVATDNMNNLESFRMNITVRNTDNGFVKKGYALITEDYINYSVGSLKYHIIYVDGESQLIVPFFHTYTLEEDDTFDLKQEIPIVRFGDLSDFIYDEVNKRYIGKGTVEDFDDVEEIILKIEDSHITFIEFESDISGTIYRFTLEFEDFNTIELTTPQYISNIEKTEFEALIQKIGFFGFHDSGENLGLDFNEGNVECRLSTSTCIFETTSPIEYNIENKTITSSELGIETPILYSEHRSDNETLQALFEIIIIYYTQLE